MTINDCEHRLREAERRARERLERPWEDIEAGERAAEALAEPARRRAAETADSLRRSREAGGVSLEAAAEAAGILPMELEAFEDGVATLPGGALDRLRAFYEKTSRL